MLIQLFWMAFCLTYCTQVPAPWTEGWLWTTSRNAWGKAFDVTCILFLIRLWTDQGTPVCRLWPRQEFALSRVLEAELAWRKDLYCSGDSGHEVIAYLDRWGRLRDGVSDRISIAGRLGWSMQTILLLWIWVLSEDRLQNRVYRLLLLRGLLRICSGKFGRGFENKRVFKHTLFLDRVVHHHCLLDGVYPLLRVSVNAFWLLEEVVH